MEDASSPSGSNAKRGSIADSFKSAFAAIDPLAKNVSKEINKGFFQAVQFAGEKIGTAEVTPFPQEYVDLEQRFERIRALHENLIKVGALQVSPGPTTDMRFAMYGALSNVAETIGTSEINTVNEKLRTVTINPHSPNDTMADEMAQGGAATGDGTPLGSALIKCSGALKGIGKARIQMNSEINDKFVRVLSHNLETKIRNVNHHRRTVYNARLRLDALKTRARSSSPQQTEALSDDLQVLQAEFNSLVTATAQMMKEVVEGPETLSALADLMASMLTYFQTGYELLTELAPEIDSMKVAQESVMENPDSRPFSE